MQDLHRYIAVISKGLVFLKMREEQEKWEIVIVAQLEMHLVG